MIRLVSTGHGLGRTYGGSGVETSDARRGVAELSNLVRRCRVLTGVGRWAFWAGRGRADLV
eukprot:1878258-Rhodomonas_salina.7